MEPSRVVSHVGLTAWRARAFTGVAMLLAVAVHAFAADGPATSKHAGTRPAKLRKLDRELAFRADHRPSSEQTTVIVTVNPASELPNEFKRFGKGALRIINGHVLTLPNGALEQLAAHPDIFDVHYDRPLHTTNYRTALTTGSRSVNRGLGFTGAGVGVAVIDSGIARWHDDLTTNRSARMYPYGNQRVSAFMDFVQGQSMPYDDEGHGTHVAGIIGGNGYDSNGQQAGVAPEASLVALKVLDANGQGNVSNMIKALDWVVANRTRYRIRVANLSVGAAVTESYWTDPLTLAAKRVVDAGVVVVAAAGNLGTNAKGEPQYGGIVAPGNAPWVITVAASSTNGTPGRGDDTMAGFSSRGPTYLDWSAKPDLSAPGVGTVSLADPWGTSYTTNSAYLLPGTVPTAYKPYLALTGTSMAAPVVSGTIALMLQANPTLTPNAVKAILQYTAQVYPGYNALTEGAGFLNTLGAVRLARFYATSLPGQRVPTQSIWSKRIIWGNYLVTGGVLDPLANAFRLGTTWGVEETADGRNVVWGTRNDDNVVWGTGDRNNIVWGTDGRNNIVWGTDCGGANCDNIVWGTDGDNVVWGTGDRGDNVVWGTDGGNNGDNVVWGTGGRDNGDNVVWGTGRDNVVWGTSAAGAPYSNSHIASSLRLLETYLRRYSNLLTDAQVFQWIASLTSGGF
jgi:serine protease AprX